MVISTFLSAPIMYVSAWLLTIPLMDPTPLVTELENVSFNISIVSLVALVSTFTDISCGSVNRTERNTEMLITKKEARRVVKKCRCERCEQKLQEEFFLFLSFHRFGP